MHHSNNNVWTAIQQEQATISFWGWVNAIQQRQTNRRIEQSNAALWENNRLLEQIRRQLLSPAERAAEDAQRRAAQAARLKKEAEDRKAMIKTFLVIGTTVAAICFLSLANSTASQKPSPEIPGAVLVQPADQQSAQPPVPAPSTTPEPRIETTPAPVMPATVRRAQLVRVHHHL